MRVQNTGNAFIKPSLDDIHVQFNRSVDRPDCRSFSRSVSLYMEDCGKHFSVDFRIYFNDFSRLYISLIVIHIYRPLIFFSYGLVVTLLSYIQRVLTLLSPDKIPLSDSVAQAFVQSERKATRGVH